MNAMPFPRRFPWLPALGILTFSGGLFLCNWLVWTPIERYYLGTYLKCTLLGTDRGSSAEVRWLYKTAPHGKQELALDADVVPATAGGDRRIPGIDEDDGVGFLDACRELVELVGNRREQILSSMLAVGAQL